MAKTPKPKKKEPSLSRIHSRAARRQSSRPPKSQTPKTQDSEAPEQPWLYHTHNAGITKKQKAKKLTHNQRMRQQRSLENAERNGDKHEKKVADSKRRSKKIQSRRAEWEDLDGVVGGGVGGKENADGKHEGKGEDGIEDEVGKERKVKGGNWTDGMVEVELKEAMEEIEGFELPSVGKDGDAGLHEEAMADTTSKAEADNVRSASPEVDEVT